MKTRPGRRFMVPKSSPANPRTEWALRGAGPVTFSLTAVRAALAARGTLWPLAEPTCQVGSKPAGRGFFEGRTETPAAGRGLNWSRRGAAAVEVLRLRLHLKHAESGSGTAANASERPPGMASMLLGSLGVGYRPPRCFPCAPIRRLLLRWQWLLCAL
jgi:hypothetical protein